MTGQCLLNRLIKNVTQGSNQTSQQKCQLKLKVTKTGQMKEGCWGLLGIYKMDH